MYMKKSRLPGNVLKAGKGEDGELDQKVDEFKFFTLMRYASTVERTLQILGIIACIIAGAALVSCQVTSEQHS